MKNDQEITTVYCLNKLTDRRENIGKGEDIQSEDVLYVIRQVEIYLFKRRNPADAKN